MDSFSDKGIEFFSLFTFFDGVANAFTEDLSHVDLMNACLVS